MELELELKISKTIEDIHSTNFRIAKDRDGPIFLLRETEAMFILTSHFRGFRRDDIKININEDGTEISISSEKLVQETIIKGWVMHKNEPNIKGFIKEFIIPSGVILDRIKADYNDDESTLTIYMPKENKGVMIGGGIEEVKDENKVSDQESLHEEQVSEDNVKDIGQVEEIRYGGRKINEVVSKSKRESDDDEVSSSIQDIKNECDKNEEEIVEEKLEDGCETRTKGEKGDIEARSYDEHELEEGNSNNYCKLFGPCFFIGSTLAASLVMLLVRLVKRKTH